ncbi:CIR protein [Plasmodium chabaudi chabaudi]|uniref:CIR protein n=1 Tax=Plasmodium chabaudi chabaudi TaxID=31271 RepID=A0A1D3L882_PLACU|nr:CIR protein [Plasmodium chabaudi chabaudi]
MDEEMCQYFKIIWDDFPDTLSDGNYNFNASGFCDTYCDENCDDNCDTDLDKINAGCLYFLKTFLGNYDSINNDATSYMNIAQYIIIWLSHMLSLKKNDNISNLNDFYNAYIKDDEKYNEKYNEEITDDSDDTTYKNLINKIISSMNMDMSIISKFYNALKILCNMYNEINSETPNCRNYYGKTKNLFDEYKKLLNDDIKDSPYNKLLSTLSTDYDNFKSFCAKKCNGCNDIPTHLDIKTAQFSAHGSELTSSSSSVASKLIPALLISSIPIFLGIAYKYSLFGFGKRVQRQNLREKPKKIKKKMNHHI